MRYDPGFLVAMLEEVGVLKIGNVGDWDYLSFLDKVFLKLCSSYPSLT